MKVNLSQQDCSNVRVALLVAAKQQEVDENVMKVLLMLSDKFIYKEDKQKEKPSIPKGIINRKEVKKG